VSPSVLADAVRTTSATPYELTVGGTVNVQGQGFPLRGGGRAGHFAVDVGQTRKAIDVSPARLLGYAQAATDARRVGRETVDGVPTTHYYAEIDLSRYAIRRTLGDSLPVDVWIDGSGRIRRVTAQLSAAGFDAVPQVDVRPLPPRPARAPASRTAPGSRMP
jgi:hypothetical protein